MYETTSEVVTFIGCKILTDARTKYRHYNIISISGQSRLQITS